MPIPKGPGQFIPELDEWSPPQERYDVDNGMVFDEEQPRALAPDDVIRRSGEEGVQWDIDPNMRQIDPRNHGYRDQNDNVDQSRPLVHNVSANLKPDSGFLQETPDGGTEFTTAFRGGFGASATKPAEMTAPGVQMADAGPVKSLDELLSGRVDDDYQKTLDERGSAETLDWLTKEAERFGTPIEQPKTFIDALNQVPSTIAAQAPDLAGVFTEAGHWAVGGPMRAVEGLIDTGRDLAYTIGGPGRDENGNWKWLSPEEVRAKGIDPGLPNIGGFMDAPETTTATMLQGFTQFITGFVGAGKVVGTAQGASAATLALNTLLRAGLSDFFAFQGKEPNIANMLPEASSNPLISTIRDYLAVDEETPEMVGRLKRVIADTPLNAMFEGVLAGLRRVKAWRKEQQLSEPQGAPPPGQDQQPAPQPVSQAEAILGTPEQPLIAPVMNAGNDLGVPLQVAAKSLLPESSKAPDIAPGMVRLYRAEVKGSDIPIGPDVTDDLSKAQADIKALGGLERGNQISYWDVPKERAAELAQQAEVPKAQQGASSLSRIPTFDDIMAVLPKDANGDVDAALLTQKIQSLGKKSFNDLSVSEKVALFKEFGGTAKAQTPDASGPLPLPDVTQQPSVASGGTGQPPNAPPPAASAGAAPASQFSNEFKFNWSKIETDDDMKKMAGQVMDAFADDLRAKGKGVKQTWKETAEKANALSAIEMLVGEGAQKGKALDAVQLEAAGRIYVSALKDLSAVSKIAAMPNAGPEDLIAFDHMLRVFRMAQNLYVPAQAEAGRALNILRKTKADSTLYQEELRRFVSSMGGMDAMQTRASAINDLIQRGPEKLPPKVLDKALSAKTLDTVMEMWKAGLLSGPQTHIVNTVSNASVLMQVIAERKLAGMIGEVLDPADGVKAEEAVYMAWGMKQHFRDALRAMATSWKTGEQQWGAGQVEAPLVSKLSSEHWGISPTSPVKSERYLAKGLDMFGRVYNWPFRALGASDAFFKEMNFGAELKAMALRQASEDVIRGRIEPNDFVAKMQDYLDNPSEALRAQARRFAGENTFTNEPGKFLKMLVSMRNTENEYGRFIANFVMPFAQTPGNILNWQFERSPLAMLSNRVRADIEAGGARRDIALAKMGIGSLMLGVGWDMGMDGTITAGGPEFSDPKRQAMMRGGWRPWSIKIAAGTEADGKTPVYQYVPINRFDPAALPLLYGAALAEMGKYKNGKLDKDFDEVWAAATLTLADVMMQKSTMVGLANLLEAMSEPKRFAEQYAISAARSTVPAGMAWIEGIKDPVIRSTWDMISGVKARIPYLSEELPARLDLWGREMTTENMVSAPWDSLIPSRMASTKGAQPIDRELVKLNKRLSFPDGIPIEGVEVPLRNFPEAQNRLVKLMNSKASGLARDNEDDLYEARKGNVVGNLEQFGDKTLLESLNEMIKGEGPFGAEYMQADAETKGEMLSKVKSLYEQAARVQVLREFPEIKRLRATVKSPEQLGIEAPF